MPYKSDAQRKKFHVLEADGKMAPSVVDEWDAASKGMKLTKKKKTKGMRGTSEDDLK